MIVISDTSPINYLVLIGHVSVLPTLFGQVVIPAAVLSELRHLGTPAVVHQWINQLPNWVVVRTPTHVDPLIQLGHGEAAAISLAVEIQASLVLMDDRKGRREAISRGLSVAGTINVLEAAAQRDLLDFPTAVAKLRQTNFHIAERVIQQALDDDRQHRSSQYDRPQLP